jgi:hypothetical protein
MKTKLLLSLVLALGFPFSFLIHMPRLIPAISLLEAESRVRSIDLIPGRRPTLV